MGDPLKIAEMLEEGAMRIDVDGTPAQAGPAAYELRRAARVIREQHWPIEAEYSYGQPVEKFTGEAQWDGVIVSAYHTTAGKLRYVVEVKPQGFQMIAVPTQLRSKIKHGGE